jgi:3-hydroxyisobutyrate dehydrogenase-like beta-hydroxyacid dehydrogenase
MREPTQIGFIGLGQMGAPMAQRLLAPEITLHVFDPSEAAARRLADAGAVRHASPAAVADAATLVFACLPNPQVSETVALGADGVASGKAIRVYVEMSTIGTATIGRIADGLARHAIATVDAPISGGPPGARAGTLAVMAAGAPEALAVADAALRRIGRTVYILGDRPGLGQTMKLVNNLVVAANMASTFEALVLGAKAGLDPSTMVDVLNASTGRSLVTTDIVPRAILPGSFDFGATIAVMDKDVTLGLAEAAALSVPMWTLEQAARLWHFAVTQGRKSDDITTMIQMLEDWAGAKVRSRDVPG